MRKVKYVIPLMLLVSLVVGAQEKESAAGRWSLTPHIGTNLWTAKYGDNNGKELGLTAGAELGLQLMPRVSLSLGADYVLQRFTVAPTYRGHCTVGTGRACFPLQVGVNFWKGFSLHSGIQPGLTLHTCNGRAMDGYGHVAAEADYSFDKVHWYLPGIYIRRTMCSTNTTVCCN